MTAYPQPRIANPRKHRRSIVDPSGAQTLYASKDFNVSAFTAGSVEINVSISGAPVDFDKWRDLIVSTEVAAASRAANQTREKTSSTVREAMKSALVALFSHRLSKEMEQVVDAYRVMLRESLAKGDDADLQTALNRARLQEKILAGTSMVDQAQACELLGLSATNPSATMKRKEDKREILRFTVDGRAAYPLFQFDVEGRRIFPTIAKLIAVKPETWSDFRLLHWLTRPHLSFDGTPGGQLAEGEEVVAAFEREIAPAEQG